MGLSQREVAQMLGLSEARVSQLKTRGQLTDFSSDGIEKYKRKKEEREKENREYRERFEIRHQELLDELQKLNRNVLILAAALVGKEAIDRLT